MVAYSPDRRERARQLVAEGRFGGSKHGKLGGRPRVPRASELAAEEAVRHADEIVHAFRDALDPSQPALTRVKAAAAWLKIEHQDAVFQQCEERFDRMTDADLVEVLAARIGRLLEVEEIRDVLETLPPPRPPADPTGVHGESLELEASTGS
jgi:hypothetical protein